MTAAYGWLRDGHPETDLPDAEILTRLVALNAARAAEEAAGTIRWLRPEYQGGARPPGALQASLTMEGGDKANAPRAKKNARRSARSTGAARPKTPWPKSLAERVRATELALQASAVPVTAAELAKRFTRANPEDLAEILETLATLGRAHRDGEKFTN